MSRASLIRGRRTRAGCLATASALLMPLAAHAQTVANVDVSAGALVASNPHLVDGPDTGSAAATLTVHPSISVTEGRTKATLGGTLRLEEFFDRYGTDTSAQVGASIEHSVNERTTLSADVGYSSSDSAARHLYGGADLSDLEPGEFPDSPVVDPTLGNIAGRTSRLNVNFGLRQLLSSNSALTLASGLGLTRVKSGNGADYRDTSAFASYSHRLNERTSLLVSLDVGYADYLGRELGDGLFTTALVGVDHQFTESMYGTVQVGLSYSEVDVLLGAQESFTTWAASLQLCDMLARGTICVSGSRTAEPTSLGGLTMVNSVGASYSRAIGADANISFGASYSKTGTPDSAPLLLSQRESEIAHISGTYSHRIAERLSAFLTPSFTSNEREFTGKEENYQVMAGITYRFGRTP